MALESDVGVVLLERNRRMVRLTAAGESLLTDAEQLLTQEVRAKARALSVSSGHAGHLKIAFVASAAPQLMPRIVLAFRDQYPGVSLELKNLPTALQVDALLSHSVDLGFVRLPLTAPGLSITPVHEEPFAIVISKSHRLASQRQLTVAHLAGEHFVAYGQRWAPEFYQTWTGLCRRAGFTPIVVQETAEMDTALALVAAGMGVAILPEGVANRPRGGLKVTSLRYEKLRSEIGIAVSSDRVSLLATNLIHIALRL